MSYWSIFKAADWRTDCCLVWRISGSGNQLRGETSSFLFFSWFSSGWFKRLLNSRHTGRARLFELCMKQRLVVERCLRVAAPSLLLLLLLCAITPNIRKADKPNGRHLLAPSRQRVDGIRKTRTDSAKKKIFIQSDGRLSWRQWGTSASNTCPCDVFDESNKLRWGVWRKFKSTAWNHQWSHQSSHRTGGAFHSEEKGSRNAALFINFQWPVDAKPKTAIDDQTGSVAPLVPGLPPKKKKVHPHFSAQNVDFHPNLTKNSRKIHVFPWKWFFFVFFFF